MHTALSNQPSVLFSSNGHRRSTPDSLKIATGSCTTMALQAQAQRSQFASASASFLLHSQESHQCSCVETGCTTIALMASQGVGTDTADVLLATVKFGISPRCWYTMLPQHCHADVATQQWLPCPFASADSHPAFGCAIMVLELSMFVAVELQTLVGTETRIFRADGTGTILSNMLRVLFDLGLLFWHLCWGDSMNDRLAVTCRKHVGMLAK